MQLLLGFLLATVVFGLITERLDLRAYGYIIGCACLMTMLFYFSPRFWL